MRVRCPTTASLVLLLLAAAPGASATGQTARTRTSSVFVTAPAQFNLTLAQVRFGSSGGAPARLALSQAPGLYLVAGALVRRPVAGGPRALILAVNRRPRGSLAPDRARIGVRVTAARRFGLASLRQLATVLPRPPGIPSICGGPGHRRTLAAADLRPLLSAGPALPGFNAAAAVAQAFDVVCARPSDPAFAQAVTGCSTTGFAAGCCPPNAVCAAPPSPTPAPTPSPTPTPTPMPAPCTPCQRPPCTTAICPLAQTAALRVIVCPLPATGAVAC